MVMPTIRLFSSPSMSFETTLARSAEFFGCVLLARVERSPRDSPSVAASSSSSSPSEMAVPFKGSDFGVTLMLLAIVECDDILLRLRLAVRGGSSSSGEVVLRFLSERDPSSGSSRRIRLLNTECESGFMPPLACGNRSRASLGTEERRRAAILETSLRLSSGSRPFSTQSLQRHWEVSIHISKRMMCTRLVLVTRPGDLSYLVRN